MSLKFGRSYLASHPCLMELVKWEELSKDETQVSSPAGGLLISRVSLVVINLSQP